MAREASIEQTLTDGIEHHLENFHFSIPAIVIRSDLDNMQVDVQPSLNIKMFDGGSSSERPSIVGVPLVFPSSKTAGFTFPVNTGDSVLLVFSERGLDAWKAGNGYPSTPTDFRMMDYKDAIAIPGLMPRGQSIDNPSKHVHTHNTGDTVIFSNLGGVESEVRLKTDGSVEINTSNQPVTINCSVANINANQEVNINTPVMNVDADTTNWIGSINLQGSIVQVGNWTQTGNYSAVGIQSFNSIIFSTHKHGTSPPPSN